MFITEKLDGKIIAVIDLFYFDIIGHWSSLKSAVLFAYQGQGLGFALYESAINYFGSLCSSTNLSAGSSVLWRRLVTKYHGVLLVPRSNNYLKLISVKIVGWEKQVGITYPVLLLSDGSRKNLLQIRKDTSKRMEKGAVASSFYLVSK
jgi:hypothetical protein